MFGKADLIAKTHGGGVGTINGRDIVPVRDSRDKGKFPGSQLMPPVDPPVFDEAAGNAGIPVYGSDPVMVKSGALACVSVSNTQLGQRSAEMADEILRGKAVSEVPAEAMSDYNYVVSQAAADALNITLPEDGSVTIIGG